MTKTTRKQNPLAHLIENDGDKSGLFEEIGRFIFEYSKLEFALRRHFRRKIGYKIDFDDVVSTGFDFAKLCNALTALTTAENGGKPDAALKPLLDECHRINAVRIAVVHGSWFSTLAEDRVVHVSRSSMKRQTLFRQAGDLDKHSDAMVKLRADIAQAIYDANERRKPGEQ
jgi:hypothetical protein